MGEEGSFFQKYWPYLVLVIIVLFGLYLRLYHDDYPVVGYHNWKETHYLTEARNFAREGIFAHGIFVPAWDYPDMGEDPSGVHSDTFPTTPILVGELFKLFGISLVLARIVNVLLALGSVVMMYFLVRKLFSREDLALTSAALMSINPLLVFFGHQMDLLNSALFFCLLGLYFYLEWLENFSWKNTILFSLFLFLGVFTKYSFALFLIPAFFIFPFAKLKEKKLWPKYGVVGLVGALFVAWYFYMKTVSSTLGEELSKVQLSLVFKGEFWTIMKSFLSDNFTLWGIIFFLLGIIIFFVSLKKKYFEWDQGTKFFLFYLGGAVIWFLILAEKMEGHNYHQYPLIPLIVFFIAYLFVLLANTLSKMLKSVSAAKWIILVLLIGGLYFPCAEAKNRMFDTQFFGLDLAGDYVNSHKLPGDTAMHSSHQAYGFLWHADMKGMKMKKTLSDFQKAETERGFKWLFIYQWDFGMMQDKELWGYISSNYHLVQMGFMQNNQGIQPYYFLLKKGGSINTDQIAQMMQGKPIQTKEYELSSQKVEFEYINFE